jgi:hypothetical protein
VLGTPPAFILSRDQTLMFNPQSKSYFSTIQFSKIKGSMKLKAALSMAKMAKITKQGLLVFIIVNKRQSGQHKSWLMEN